MTIKIMLNKDEEINKLALDPEVQLKIKAAIMDAIGSRACKAVDKDYHLTEFINRTVEEYLHGPKHTWCLSDNVEKQIKEHVEQDIFLAIENISSKEPEKYWQMFRDAVDRKLKELENLDVKEVFTKSVDRYIRTKMG